MLHDYVTFLLVVGIYLAFFDFIAFWNEIKKTIKNRKSLCSNELQSSFFWS